MEQWRAAAAFRVSEPLHAGADCRCQTGDAVSGQPAMGGYRDVGVADLFRAAASGPAHPGAGRVSQRRRRRNRLPAPELVAPGPADGDTAGRVDAAGGAGPHASPARRRTMRRPSGDTRPRCDRRQPILRDPDCVGAEGERIA